VLNSKPSEDSCIYSRLVPGLFEDSFVDAVDRVRVLELGPAQGNTISFLNQFNCRLKILDIVEDLIKISRQYELDDAPDPEDVKEQIKTLLNLSSGDIFDVCLFWDSFNYFSTEVLRLFCQALVPHLSDRFRGHGFAVLNKSSDLYQQRYGIINRDLLAVGDKTQIQLPYRHSQAVIKDHLNGIAIKQSILREDGRLEMLLSRS
jgi:hypothetical protein